MTTVLLVRHAVTATTGKRLYGRRPGVELDARGLAQAAALGARFQGRKIDAVYASPLERAQQTAKPLAKAVGVRVRTREGLLESDVGEWTDKTLAQLRRRREWNLVQRAPSRFRFPGGESFRQLQERATAEVERLVRQHPDGTIACVSHADPIKAIIAHYVGLHLDHIQRLHVAPASVSSLAVDPEGGVMLLAVNDTCHLEGAA